MLPVHPARRLRDHDPRPAPGQATSRRRAPRAALGDAVAARPRGARAGDALVADVRAGRCLPDRRGRVARLGGRVGAAAGPDRMASSARRPRVRLVAGRHVDACRAEPRDARAPVVRRRDDGARVRASAGRAADALDGPATVPEGPRRPPDGDLQHVDGRHRPVCRRACSTVRWEPGVVGAAAPRTVRSRRGVGRARVRPARERNTAAVRPT
jgi:hypothetical protein